MMRSPISEAWLIGDCLSARSSTPRTPARLRFKCRPTPGASDQRRVVSKPDVEFYHFRV